MAKALKQNVHVDGKWYGPDYPKNKVTADVLDQITNPQAFEDADPAQIDMRVRADDGLEPVGEFELGSANMDEILAWVGDDPDRAQDALDAEGDRAKPRNSLVAKLEEIANQAV
jgi:hypothetical protein